MIDHSPEPGVSMLTMLLAEMQTTIVTAGLRAFDGKLDRFVIATVIARDVLYARPEVTPISVLSLASSLNRPFETTRRHVHALIDLGYITRHPGGVITAADWPDNPEITALTHLSHDAFVRFAEALKSNNLLPAIPRSPRAYAPATGIRSAIDIMLAAADSNIETHGDWLNLVIFSTIVFANTQRFFSDADRSGGLDPRHAVRTSAVARTLALTDITARRRVARLSQPGGAIMRTSKGLLVSEPWMMSPAAKEASARTSNNVRRILMRAAADGFPFDDPASAYIDRRPPTIFIG
jgi:hypothetical protein